MFCLPFKSVLLGFDNHLVNNAFKENHYHLKNNSTVEEWCLLGCYAMWLL
jgi:hypothetical protein